MPTKTEQPGIFWFDGVCYQKVTPIGTLDIAPPQIGEISSKSSITLTENGAEGTVTFGIQLKRMTRKRAVKLLMSKGLDRNESKALVETWGGWYAYQFVDFLVYPPGYFSAKMYEYRIKNQNKYSKPENTEKAEQLFKG